MRILFTIAAIVAVVAVSATARAQAPQSQMDNVSCTFADGKQLSVRYQHSLGDKHDLPDGHLFPHDDAPMLLFTQTKLALGGSEIPAGAYKIYVIPDKGKWTIVINKGTDSGEKYDQSQDLARAPMQVGKIGAPTKQFQIFLVHIAPKQCNMRVYSGSIGAWAEFTEK